MAKSQQTFRKRQRERMLREKAEMKRQRREQRREEKKHSPGGTSEYGVPSYPASASH